MNLLIYNLIADEGDEEIFNPYEDEDELDAEEDEDEEWDEEDEW